MEDAKNISSSGAALTVNETSDDRERGSVFKTNPVLQFIKDKKAIILLNKNDLHVKVKEDEIRKITGDKPILHISALNRDGIDELYKTISNMYKLNEIEIDDSLTITNNRHKQAIDDMIKNVEKAKDSIHAKMPLDVVTIHITDILNDIGKITGESVSEDVINEIFKKFCLGK